jgi:glycosyltransferase involved in cell wall biosynthesis
LKILTLVYSIGPGGTERAAVNYAIGYKNFGIDSRVWVLGEGLDRKPSLDKFDVTVYLDTATVHKANFSTIQQWRPDIIHIHRIDDTIFKLLQVFKASGSKIVQTNVFSRPIYNDNYKIIDASFQLASWGVWKYHNWMRGEKNAPVNLRVPYIINAADFSKVESNARIALRRSLELPDNAIVAGRVGQAHPSKWDKRIFTIVEKVTQDVPNLFFVFVGLPADLKKAYNELPAKIKTQIRLIDFIAGDEKLSEFYKSIDLFVHISKIGESFGYVLVESLVSGCPVVTYVTPLKDNAQFEIISNNEGGRCAASDLEVIQSIKELASNQNLSKQKMIKDVTSRYSEEVVIPAMLSIYRDLLKRDITSLQKRSKQDVLEAQTVYDKQMSRYGFEGLFLKTAFQLLHQPLIAKKLGRGL